MAEFTYLQRLFRALLDGRLVLGEMDLASLVELAVESGRRVRRTERPAWLAEPYLVDGMGPVATARGWDRRAAVLVRAIRKVRDQRVVRGQARTFAGFLGTCGREGVGSR